MFVVSYIYRLLKMTDFINDLFIIAVNSFQCLNNQKRYLSEIFYDYDNSENYKNYNYSQNYNGNKKIKISNGKYLNDKYLNDKYLNDKYLNDKYLNDKYLNNNFFDENNNFFDENNNTDYGQFIDIEYN
jgi:hypothetical protein